MGETWNDSKLQTVGTSGYVSVPAQMRYFFLAKTASTFQVHGIGPFVVNYVNPADDPNKEYGRGKMNANSAQRCV